MTTMFPVPGDSVSTPNPSFEKTYKSAAGDEMFGEYGWVTDIDAYDIDEPLHVIEETWERTGVRTFWKVPTSLYDCDEPECDEDAVGWVLKDDEPLQLCAAHSEGLPVIL